MVALVIILGVAVIAAALCLYLIAAKHDERMKKYENGYYAHRGLHGRVGDYEDAAPENTLKAFKRAVEMNFGIELDVRLTKDEKMVVFHDDTLKRAAGIDKKIGELTYAELSEIPLFGSDERVPLFTEVLELVNGSVPLLVEIKDDGFAKTPEIAMQILKDYKGEFIVESFNPLIMGKVRKFAPEVLRGFLCEHLTNNPEYKAFKYHIVERNLLNFIAKPHFIAGSFKSFPFFPSKIVKLLFRPAMLAWTVKSKEDEAEARSKGFTGMIFEGYIPDRKM